MAQCLVELPLFGSFTLFTFFFSPFSSATVSPSVTCSTSVFWLQDTCHLPATAIGCNSRGRNCRRNSYTEVRTHPTLAFPPDHRDRGSPEEKQRPAGVYILLTQCKTSRQSVVAGLTWLAWENWGKSQLIHWMRKPFRWREERWVLCREQFTRRRPLAPLTTNAPFTPWFFSCQWATPLKRTQDGRGVRLVPNNATSSSGCTVDRSKLLKKQRSIKTSGHCAADFSQFLCYHTGCMFIVQV